MTYNSRNDSTNPRTQAYIARIYNITHRRCIYATLFAPMDQFCRRLLDCVSSPHRRRQADLGFPNSDIHCSYCGCISYEIHDLFAATARPRRTPVPGAPLASLAQIERRIDLDVSRASSVFSVAVATASYHLSVCASDARLGQCERASRRARLAVLSHAAPADMFVNGVNE